MNACLLALVIALGCGDALRPAGTPASVAPSPADDWLAEDKLRHFGLSFAATSMGYGTARIALDQDPALAAAASVALALGIGKEIYDVRRGQPFSFRDLAWDAAGIALALTLARQIR